MAEPTLIAMKTSLAPDSIVAKGRLRPVSEAGVQAILGSVEELGQIVTPLTVRQRRAGVELNYELLDGAHRLEAARRLGMESVPVRVFECTNDQAKLLEIDGNLAGAELNPLDTAVFLATRKRVYERLHPETKAGVAGALHKNCATEPSSVASFATVTAEKFGLTERQVRKIVAAGSRLGPDEIAKLRQAPKAVTLKDLQVIAKIGAAPERYKVVGLLAEGAAKSAADARQKFKVSQPGYAGPAEVDLIDAAYLDLCSRFDRAPMGRYGPEATAEDVRKLFQAVANIGTDAAAVLPRSMEIDFENGPTATGDKLFETFARWTDEQISKAVLGQTMTADSGSSEAQAKVHNEVRHDIAVSDARAVTGTINRDIVRPFVDLNFGMQEAYPRLVLSIEEPEDVKARIESAVALAGIGVTFNASELRRKIGFSDPEDGDEVVGGAPAAPAAPGGGAPRLALNRAGAGDDDIDEIEADMLGDWQELADDLQGAIATVMDGAASYEDVIQRLPEALAHMPTGLAVETLVKGLFQARALGDVRDG